MFGIRHVLFMTYQQSRECSYLDEAINLHSGFLSDDALVADESPLERRGMLAIMGSYLRARYLAKGRSNDLTDAISWMQQALDLSTPGEPFRTLFLSKEFIPCLAEQCTARESLDGLDRPVHYTREVLGQLPTDDASRMPFIVAVIECMDKYLAQGIGVPPMKHIVDLIHLLREEVRNTSLGLAHRATLLGRLGYFLRCLGGAESRLPDLEESVQVGRQSLQVCPDDDDNLRVYQLRLAGSLSCLYRHTEYLPTLDQ